MSRRFVPAVLALLCAAPSASLFAQSFTQSPLVLGQVAHLQVSGAQAGDSVAFLVSFTALGVGPCFPPTGVCLDLLNPVTLLAILPTDASGAATITAVVPPSSPLVPVFTQAVVLGASSFVKTNAIASAIESLAALSDDFESGALSAEWSVLHPELAQITVSGGVLHVAPNSANPASIWYQDGEGPLVYRAVTGDFTVTAHVHSVDPAAAPAPPPAPYRLGGILVRNPLATQSSQHEFVHVTVGGGDASAPVAVEDKTTTSSVSDFVLYPIASAAGEIRITRQGSLFSLYYRATSALPWQLLRVHDHPAMPATVQVGMMAYSASSPPSLRTDFDEITFSP